MNLEMARKLGILLPQGKDLFGPSPLQDTVKVKGGEMRDGLGVVGWWPQGGGWSRYLSHLVGISTCVDHDDGDFACPPK